MKGQEIYLILYNIRSTYNVGSIFRTADAAGIEKIFLCGYTPIPSDKKIAKTALGAEKFIPWEYHRQTWRLIEKLKKPPSPRLWKDKEGVQIVALEQTKKSVDYRQFKPRFPMALVLGNEVRGLSKKILEYADKIVAIPMYGKKESLNVAVAAGIAIFRMIEHKKKKPRVKRG